MRLVVDASVAAKWLIDEPDSELAAEFLGEDLIAPSILRLECANALIRRLRMGELSHEQTVAKVGEIAKLPVRLHAFDETGAFSLALALRHPVFDCGYLALARSQAILLVTADKQFYDKASDNGFGGHVRLMSDFHT